jgi:hypothetical protein
VGAYLLLPCEYLAQEAEVDLVQRREVRIDVIHVRTMKEAYKHQGWRIPKISNRVEVELKLAGIIT